MKWVSQFYNNSSGELRDLASKITIALYKHICKTSSSYSEAREFAMKYLNSTRPQMQQTILAAFDEIESKLPDIETELTNLPKDNLFIIDSTDKNLDYILLNGAIHGLAVLLLNTERLSSIKLNKITQILIEHDFQVDLSTNREFIRYKNDEYIINPKFKLILQVSLPIQLNSNKCLFSRLVGYQQYTQSHINSPSNFIIDFSSSLTYISNDFLNTLLDYERPGYKNQVLLSEKLNFEANTNILNRQV